MARLEQNGTYRACSRLGISGTVLDKVAPIGRLGLSGTYRARPPVRLAGHPAFKKCSSSVVQVAGLIYTGVMTQAYGRTDLERGVSRFHFTLEHYHTMIEAGLLEGKRVQLIRGELLEMTPMGPPHIGRITILTMQLVASLRGRAAVSSQTPISLETKDTEPEADFVILSLEVFQESQFENRLPRAREVSALVEVSDSSLAFDRGEKLTLYAENGVKEVWILVVKTGRLEVYRNPRDGAYLEKRMLEPGESARFLDYPDVEVVWWTL